MRVLLISLLWVVGVTGCSRCSSLPPAGKELPNPHPVDIPDARAAKPAEKNPRDPRLVQIVKLSVQADQIVREAWWVLAGEKLPAPRSVFGKVQRAALWTLDGRLATKNVFRCDRYEMKLATQSRWSAEFSEVCVKNSSKNFALWTFESDHKARVEFFPQHLGEVMGLSASVYGRRLSCTLEWSGEAILDRLSCPNWEQDRQHQLLHLDVFEYRREGGSLLRLKGKLLENLQPVKKIESEVPLEGKIVVTETEMAPPASVESKAPAVGKAVLPNPPPKAGVVTKPGVKAPAARSLRQGAPGATSPTGRNADLPAPTPHPPEGMPPNLVPVLDPSTGQMIFVPPEMIPPGAMPQDMVPMEIPRGWPGNEYPPGPQPPLPLADPEFIDEGAAPATPLPSPTPLRGR